MYGANRRERNGDRELRNCRKEGLQDARGKLQRRVERDGMGWQQLCKEFLGGGECATLPGTEERGQNGMRRLDRRVR